MSLIMAIVENIFNIQKIAVSDYGKRAARYSDA